MKKNSNNTGIKITNIGFNDGCNWYAEKRPVERPMVSGVEYVR